MKISKMIRQLGMAFTIAVTAIFFSGTFSTSVMAATFTVNSTADSDDGNCNASNCTLREAINAANVDTVLDTIAFAVPGCGPSTTVVCTLTPSLRMPIITQPVMMNGTLSNGLPGVEIDNSGVPVDRADPFEGLHLFGHDGSTIEGMIIHSSGPASSGNNVFNELLLEDGDFHTVRNNYFGTDKTGLIAKGTRGESIHFRNSSNALVENNVASGSGEGGVQFIDSNNNTLRFNKIGVGSDGITPLGNFGNGATIGGVGHTFEGNVMSNNLLGGIFLINTTGATVIDNIFENNGIGIRCSNICQDSLISGNIIRGNTHGIYVGIFNYIDFPLAFFVLRNILPPPIGAVNNRIEFNTISDNYGDGIMVVSDFDAIITAFCWDNPSISTDGPAFISIDNEILREKRELGFTYEEAVDAARSSAYWVDANGDSKNDICSDEDGRGGIPVGVPIVNGVYQENLCGGIELDGPLFTGASAPCDGNSVNNSILANSIFNNGNLGINLNDSQDNLQANHFNPAITFGAFGIFDTANPNDDLKDGDAGANNLQNFPDLNDAELKDGVLEIKGHLESERDKDYRLDFYASPAGTAAPVEGKDHLGFIEVSTTGGGKKSFEAEFEAVDGGSLITATATEILVNMAGSENDVYGSTSEFSSGEVVEDDDDDKDDGADDN